MNWLLELHKTQPIGLQLGSGIFARVVLKINFMDISGLPAGSMTAPPFDPKQTRAGIVTCGGLCPGLNNVIRPLFLELHCGYGVAEVLGFRGGYGGLDRACGADWNDLDFMLSHGNEIAKIAIVGEPRWEVEALAFAGAGFRSAPVKFFQPRSSPQRERGSRSRVSVGRANKP